MTVFQYPALTDNYNWIITCPETNQCAGVDIYNTETFFNYITEHNLTPVAVLNTHHHNDHTGGNQEIAEKYPDLKFYGSKYDFANKRIDCQNIGLSEGDSVNIGNISLSVLEIPGHTLGHICYFNDRMAFVGDTMFASGCGRLFEGTAAQMHNSLEKLVKSLNHDIPVYCGHEYTLSNLNFSCSLNESYFNDYKNKVAGLREQNKMTLPTTMATELEFNPFVMVRDEHLKNEILGLNQYQPEQAFAVLRQKKDNF